MKLIKKSIIPGCFLFSHPNFHDERGFLMKVFSSYFIKKYLKNKRIMQVNYSLTKKQYSIRGLHYQNPLPEFKIVKCLDGKVFDVVLDLRKKSKTFLKHEKFILDSKEPHLLLIPENCAHGYQTLKKNTKILYLHTNNYDPNISRGINFKDPNLNINWPKKPSKISVKDSKLDFINIKKFKGL